MKKLAGLLIVAAAVFVAVAFTTSRNAPPAATDPLVPGKVPPMAQIRHAYQTSLDGAAWNCTDGTTLYRTHEGWGNDLTIPYTLGTIPEDTIKLCTGHVYR